MVYRLYDDDTGEFIDSPGFETLDELNEFIDRAFGIDWDIISDSEDSICYEITTDDEYRHILARLEA